MIENRQPESAKEKTPDQKTGDSAKAAPASTKPKPDSKPPRKSGPSVIIGPGPGSDVVATPPRRI
ncbi:MAG TPA: hypothetical protein VFC07_04390 [Verrucomicrobiae bacterium]|nr:hypothetical protein [Verrucomicrobiae bacterium]